VQILECNIFHPNIQVDLNPLFFCNNARSHCEFTRFLWFYFHSTFAIDFILLIFHITGAFNSPFLHGILSRFVPVTSLTYAHVLLTFLHSPLARVTSSSHIVYSNSVQLHLHSDFLRILNRFTHLFTTSRHCTFAGPRFQRLRI
jgi:hypothetical protein